MRWLRQEEQSALERNALPEAPAGLEACHPAHRAAVAAMRTTSHQHSHRMKDNCTDAEG